VWQGQGKDQVEGRLLLRVVTGTTQAGFWRTLGGIRSKQPSSRACPCAESHASM